MGRSDPAVINSLADQELFERSCAGKEKYTSASAAQAALKALAKAGLLTHASRLQVYRCRFKFSSSEDPHYHFGH